MASQAIAARQRRSGTRPTDEEPSRLAWLTRIPPWLRLTFAALIVLGLMGGAGYLFYSSLDPLYPQDLWRYFRPAPPVATGSVLYRDLDGQLILAPVANVREGRRLLDATAAAGGQEFVRDAIALPDGKHVAYFATVRVPGQGEQDRVKVVTLEGALVRDIGASIEAGEALRPSVFTSSSGQYLGVTNRDRTRAFYYDLTAGGSLAAGQLDAPPERMLWTRNGDLRQAHAPGQTAIAASPDGKFRAQVRTGKRRAPECDEARCESGQELIVSSGTVAGSAQSPSVLYGAFSAFSAEGWGPVPTQAAQRLYGRLVWSPDGRQLLFSTLDGPEASTYAISTDGRTQPRLVIEAGEALDWLR